MVNKSRLSVKYHHMEHLLVLFVQFLIGSITCLGYLKAW